jgi:hypothetical protein
MLRGIWYRAGRSAVVALLAAVAVAAAVLAPGFARAAQQSVLTDGLAAAPASAAGLTVTGTGTAAATPAAHEPVADARLVVDATVAGHPALAGVLDPPVGGVDTEATVRGGSEKGASERSGEASDAVGVMAARLAYRDGVCGQLTVTGDCPAGPGEVLVSDRTAQEYGIAPGDRLAVRVGSARLDATVVGTYRPVDPTSRYWGRTVYFVQGGFDPASGAPRVDAVFTGAETDVQADPGAPVTLALTYPLRAGAVRLDGVAGLRGDLRALAGAGGLEVTTELPAVLDDAARDQRAIGRVAPVVAVPLFLLAWFVLFLLVAAVTEERGGEIALAKLRGFPAGRVARFGLGEVLVLVGVAAPVGVLLGLAMAELAARAVLAGGVDVELRWPVLAAAAGALAAVVLAVLAAARGTLRRGALDLLRRVPERTRWRAGAVEGIVVALAAASLAVAVGDRTDPLALLAPALLAVVAGLATARLVRRWSALRLRHPGGIPGLLAAAQLARRPAGQRVMVVVTVAVALLSFAALGWDAAAQARRDHATDTLGADRVYTVGADHPAALLAAVHAADPAGTSMAAVRTTGQYAGEPVELLAVDSPRLPAVADWRGADAGALAAGLRPREPAPLPVAQRLAVGVDVVELGAEPVRLTALVSAAGEPPRPVPLGTLSRGTRQYEVDLPDCRAGNGDGCRLLGFGLGRTGVAGPFTATVEFGAIRSGGGELAARFDDPEAWLAPPEATLTRAAAALTVAVAGEAASGDVILEYHETGPAVPVVLAGPAPADDPAATEFRFPGFTERPEPFTVVDRVDRLPRSGTRGLLFDLDHAVSRASRSVALTDSGGLRYEVWASPAAPADLPQRLAAHGVPVLGSDSIGAATDRLGRRAPALGLWLYLLAAAAAVVLALGVVALSTRLGAAARRADLAALRASGVPARLLRRALAREYAALLGWPLLVGLAVGVVAGLLMVPGLPLVETDAGNPAASYRLSFGVLPVAVVATAAGLLLAAARALRSVR